MLTVEEALQECLGFTRPMGAEEVALPQALGRVLAEDIVSPVDLPPWDNSAMDGFAVRHEDFPHAVDAPEGADLCAGPAHALPAPTRLMVIETIAAGGVGTIPVEPGTCARIMTGAPLPLGADAVVMREQAETADDGSVLLRDHPRSGQHVRRRGEDVRKGQTVLVRGHALRPAGVGLCAALGLGAIRVARRPTVAVLGTGDELVPPGNPLGPGQIYASNNATLCVLIAQAGAIPVDCGIAPDDLERTREALRKAASCDFVVTTGGVSVGDFDVVKEALAREGATMRFWKVRMKPGKPLAFGVLGGTPVFGLPGNPVSTVVNFLQFVRPVLRASMGDARPFLPVVEARLDQPLRKAPGREELIRVALRWERDGLWAHPVQGQGSHMLLGLSQADGFALLANDATALAAGSSVSIQLLEAGWAAASDPGYRWTASSSAVG